MSTQARSTSRTWPPELVASAKVSGRGQVITWEERAPIEMEVSVVSASDGVPNPSAVLSLQLHPAASADRDALQQRLIAELERWVVELKRRPGETVSLQMDLQGIVNG